MKIRRMIRQTIGLLLLVTWLWISLPPTPLAMATTTSQSLSQPAVATEDIETDWHIIDQQLVSALEAAYGNTEDFVISELDRWANKLGQRVDHPFLDWYFNFLHQKATEFGVPFAWLAFSADSYFKIFQTEEEKEKALSANEIIKHRMEADINREFAKQVFNEEVMLDLQDIIERAAQNYASAVGVKFASVKSRYHVPDQNWEQHLADITHIVSETTNQPLGAPGSVLTSNLTTSVLVVTTTATGAKVITNLAAKSASKLLVKGGATMAAKWGTTLLDPALAIGLVAWDIWSYKAGVDHDRPLLRKDLVGHITALRNQIQENTDGTGIMDAIASIQQNLIQGAELSTS